MQVLDMDGVEVIAREIKDRTSNIDYDKAKNKPSIENVELVGNRTFAQLGMNAMTVQEVEAILYLNN